MTDYDNTRPRPGRSAGTDAAGYAAAETVTPGGLALGALAVALSAEDLRSVIAQAGPADSRTGLCLPFIVKTAVSVAACTDIIDQADPAAFGLLVPARQLSQAAVEVSKATAPPPEQDRRLVSGQAALLRARLRRPPPAAPQPDAGALPAEAEFTAGQAARLASTLLPGYLAGAARKGQLTPPVSPAFILPQLADAAASLGWCANSAAVAAGHARAPFEAIWPIEQAAQSLWNASARLRAVWAQAGAPGVPAAPNAQTVRAVQPDQAVHAPMDFQDDLAEGVTRRPARSPRTTSQPGGPRTTALPPGSAPQTWKPGHP